MKLRVLSQKYGATVDELAGNMNTFTITYGNYIHQTEDGGRKTTRFEDRIKAFEQPTNEFMGGGARAYRACTISCVNYVGRVLLEHSLL